MRYEQYYTPIQGTKYIWAMCIDRENKTYEIHPFVEAANHWNLVSPATFSQILSECKDYTQFNIKHKM